MAGIIEEKKRKNSIPLVTDSGERYNNPVAETPAAAAGSTYTQEQVALIASEAARAAVDGVYARLNLEKRSELNSGISKENEDMPRRIRELITINGKERWLNGYSIQEVCDHYVDLLVQEGMLEWSENNDHIPLFGDYMKQFFATFKTDQEKNTLINRERIIRNHIQPLFGKKRLDRISTTELQAWLNELAKKYSRETLLKIKNTMNPVFDAAVEDEIISRNPLRSRRIKIGGKDTVGHKAIPNEKMKLIRKNILLMERKPRLMTALLSYTGMRFEEVLGLKWEDIQGEWILEERAVVHPTRNMPEIKKPKTKTSERLVPYIPALKDILEPERKTGFILSKEDDGKEPLSYSEARRVFQKIRKQFDLKEYSAHDFRDTCATEWRAAGIPLDVIARILGHAKTETTERKYVKYGEDLLFPALKALYTL